ncbi:hypothetical protein [Paraburkholderia adhaesiva]|uniref:hypothetical protein n=1 Tax=Paraburkholderia adhaesiva TaxID=2883244 RepID=UPI001F23AE30|nr:hypothetical protein [Paraburkholderia adhaesiva]
MIDGMGVLGRHGDATVYPARLMAPDEVMAVVGDRQDRSAGLGGWFLCGDVSLPMFSRLLAGTPRLGFTCCMMTGGLAGNYAVMAIQLDSYQHRFLLPLFEQPVAEFIRSLREGPLQLSLGDAGGDNAAITSVTFPQKLHAPVANLLQSGVDIDDRDTLSSWKDVVGEVCNLSMLPSLVDGRSVDDLSVSVMMPMEAFNRVLMTSDRQVDEMVH